MVNELRALLRDNIASAPPDTSDLATILTRGRRLRRRRRLTVVGGTALAAVSVTVLGVLAPFGGTDSDGTGPADEPPAPDAPTLRLADAEPAVDGRDYRVLESHTNENLERANGQYFEGVTDDGLILFKDGPHGIDNAERYALMDPATSEKNWLPDPPGRSLQLFPADLGAERLVFTGMRYRGTVDGGALFALVFDRPTGSWERVEWPSLPDVGEPMGGVVGPEGRLYVRVPATKGSPPPGGWPKDSEGEADDADAQGDSYDLWSVSLDDPADVRDEQLRVGDIAFSDTHQVWTDRTNGDAGMIHVRELATGAEQSFDPRAGDKCNLLSFGVTGERIALGQYCGTYADGVRDDRVQILSTEGEQVVTIQDTGIDGGLAHGGGSGLVTLRSYWDGTEGTYVYDLASDRFVRMSDAVSSYAMGGPTPDALFLWDTPVNGRHGATQWLGEWLG